MQDADAAPALEGVLKDLSLHPIVRHEAAEALGAIALEGNITLLEKTLVSHPAQEVRETCELALRQIEHQKTISQSDDASAVVASPFLSVDPATPSCSSVDQLSIFIQGKFFWMKRRECTSDMQPALFALRNRGGDAAVSVIIDSLGSGSALLRHEVAHVLGQLQNKAASAALVEVLKDVSEHPMVRHEALGSIADNQSVELLEEFVKDPDPLVSQSCEVLLSVCSSSKDLGSPLSISSCRDHMCNSW